MDGHCEPRFDGVRDAFGEILASGAEVGAAVAVCVEGRAVVDLWGGHADAARTRAWERDTIVNLFSVGKGVSAVCALRLVEDGRLDLDAPVARYWPDFAQTGKAALPVRYLLTHQARLPAGAARVPPGAWRDRAPMTPALPPQAAGGTPGSAPGHP